MQCEELKKTNLGWGKLFIVPDKALKSKIYKGRCRGIVFYFRKMVYNIHSIYNKAKWRRNTWLKVSTRTVCPKKICESAPIANGLLAGDKNMVMCRNRKSHNGHI